MCNETIGAFVFMNGPIVRKLCGWWENRDRYLKMNFSQVFFLFVCCCCFFGGGGGGGVYRFTTLAKDSRHAGSLFGATRVG